MCGRYAASRTPDELVEEFEVTSGPTEDLRADFNVAPTAKAYAVLERASDDGKKRKLAVVRWGLVPSWAKDPTIGNRLINARLETAREKPAFRGAMARRRCILPADGYYEWQVPTDPDAPKTSSGKPLKQPWFIHPRDGSVLGLAGLYEVWRDPTRDEDDPAALMWTVTVLTSEAPDSLKAIHDRAPLIVTPEERTAWLDPELTNPTEVIERLRPAAGELLVAYPVSTAVNSVRNNSPELLDPVASVRDAAGTGNE